MRSPLCWPTASRNEIHRHTFYDCCVLFPSLSFFVKDGRQKVGSVNTKEVDGKLGSAVWHIALIRKVAPPTTPSHQRNDRLFYSFIHPIYVRVIVFWLFFYFFCGVTTEESGKPEMLTVGRLHRTRTYARVCVCAGAWVRACSSAGNSYKTPQVSVQQQERWNGREILSVYNLCLNRVTPSPPIL